MRLQTHGANLVEPGEAVVRTAERDGVFPDDFYSTTNLDIDVRIGTDWVPVENPEMDCGVVTDVGLFLEQLALELVPGYKSAAPQSA